ncbi:glycoside hydrolase family 99-like domain-containing protein, partial [Klebsiella aerogenes]|uniref:glycoside hydrolase family 99-like domain-containing protein n=1 Tax=Klebsiella aerogenes TaxID=548 RepID=UPI001CBBABD7
MTGILTAFDNTPRRQYDDATTYGADAPSRILARFRTNLRTALYYGACCQRQTEDQFVVINAW